MTAAGIPIAYDTPITAGRCPDVDLVVAADGADSRFRHIAEVHRDPPTGTRFIWYATSARFPELTFLFCRAPWGLFTAHAYTYSGSESAFIVEATEATWHAAQAAGSVAEACTAALADHPLVPQALAAYENTRRTPAETAQDLSRRSSLWFATLDDRYPDLDAARPGSRARRVHRSDGPGPPTRCRGRALSARIGSGEDDVPVREPQVDPPSREFATQARDDDQ